MRIIMTDVLRIGLIGASRIGVEAIVRPARRLDDIAVVAVAARDAGRAAAYAAEHQIGRAHASYSALIADPDVDLVYIGTTPDTHAQLAVEALDGGKSVLVEKPFAMTASEALLVKAAAERTGKRVWEAMHSLHHPLFRTIEALVREGSIGSLQHLDAEFSALIRTDPGEFRWRAERGGGALMDLGVYPLAWCRRLAGEAFDVSTAQASIRDGVDAAFEADLAFASGATARVRASMVAAQASARLILTGRDGVIDVANPLAPQRGHTLTLTNAEGTSTQHVDGPTTYEAQLEAVRRDLRDGRGFPLPPDDYVRSMDAIDKVRTAFGRTPSS
jgi:predicted dehydrogenase